MKIKILFANSPKQLMEVTNSWLARESEIKKIISVQYSTAVRHSNIGVSSYSLRTNVIEYSVCIYYEE